MLCHKKYFTFCKSWYYITFGVHIKKIMFMQAKIALPCHIMDLPSHEYICSIFNPLLVYF